MAQAFYMIPFGLVRICYTDTILTSLHLVTQQHGQDCHTAFTNQVYQQLLAYCDGSLKTFTIPYTFAGTPFQEQVWHQLEHIPYGTTVTYGEIAKRIGKPQAARAVGSACNKNPLWLIVPCHRVIGSTGSLTGYADGIEVKRKLLEHESRHAVLSLI